jgi:tetratricopeptide (TPR) repeat protein
MVDTLESKRVMPTAMFALLFACAPFTGAKAADPEVIELVTTEMAAQITPAVQEQLDQARELLVDRPDAALVTLAALRVRTGNAALNYWETFEVLRLTGISHVRRQDYREARAALEQCLGFTDIDPYRRHGLLVEAGRVYVRLKETDRALDVYHEINNMRGGRDPQTLARIAQIYERLLGDRTAAIPYYEAAIRYDPVPKRTRYGALRTAYLLNQELEKALQVAKAMVDLFDYASDDDAMDEIIAAMNRRLQ